MKRLKCAGSYNDPIFGVAIVGSDVGVGMTGFVVALTTSQSTWGLILTSFCMMEKSEEPDAM